MPTDTLLTIAESLRSAASALEAAGERQARFEALLHRCRLMCREDGVSLGQIAEALAAEIDAALGGN